MDGEDLAPLFTDKKTDKTVATQVSTQHGPSRGKHDLKVAKIQDPKVQFGMQLVAGKLLRNQ